MKRREREREDDDSENDEYEDEGVDECRQEEIVTQQR